MIHRSPSIGKQAFKALLFEAFLFGVDIRPDLEQFDIGNPSKRVAVVRPLTVPPCLTLLLVWHGGSNTQMPTCFSGIHNMHSLCHDGSSSAFWRTVYPHAAEVDAVAHRVGLEVRVHHSGRGICVDQIGQE